MEATGCAIDEAIARGVRARLRRGRSRRPISTATTRRAKLAILCALAFGLRVDAGADRRRDDRATSSAGRLRDARARGGDDPPDRARRLRPRAVGADRLGGAAVRAARDRSSRAPTGPQNAARHHRRARGRDRHDRRGRRRRCRPRSRSSATSSPSRATGRRSCRRRSLDSESAVRSRGLSDRTIATSL